MGDEFEVSFRRVIASANDQWYWRLQPGLAELWRPGILQPYRMVCEVGDELEALRFLIRETGHEQDECT